MKAKFLFLFIYLCSLAGFACPGSGNTNTQPEITITAAECEKEKILIGVKVNKRYVTPDWVTEVEITITCDGNPLPNAELKVEYWFPGGTFKWKTDANGKFKGNGGKKQGDPKGEKIKVTISGSNGDKTETVTVP